MKRGLIHILAALVIATILSSCRQELCYDHYPRLGVSFTWEHEWERDYGMAHKANWDPTFHGVGYDELKPTVPEWINIIKFSPDGSTDERFLKPGGGQISVTTSEHPSFLLYNGDTEYIILSDMNSLPSAHASSTPRSRATITSVMDRHPGARTTNPPDVLYSAYIEYAPAVKNHTLTLMDVKMQPLVYTYVVRYEFEAGLEYVSQARGALGGMAESVYLLDGLTSDESIIILYDCNLTSYGCVAHVRSFGVPGFPDEYYGRLKAEPRDNRPYTLNLELLLKNGKTLEFNYDISDQMRHQPRGGVIRVSGIKVEREEGTVNSGFQVDVSDWGGSEIIDLPIHSE